MNALAAMTLLTALAGSQPAAEADAVGPAGPAPSTSLAAPPAGLVADAPLALQRRPPSPGTLPPRAAPGEPTVAQLRAAARALVMAEPARARSYVARARHAAWLPEVRLRALKDLGRREALDYPAIGSDAAPPLQLDTSNDVRYEIRATWDLGRIVFSPEELQAQAEALRMADVRMEVESLVIRLYFERRRLLVDRATTDDAAAVRRELRIAEIEAELDGLTGDAFAAAWGATAPAGGPTP